MPLTIFGNMLHGRHMKGSYLFHDGGPYHIETSPLICTANSRWFLYDGTTVMKELNILLTLKFSFYDLVSLFSPDLVERQSSESFIELKMK